MFLIKKSNDKQHYFVWQNRNGQISVTSETYVTEASAERGIEDFVDEMHQEAGDKLKDFEYSYTNK